MTQDTRVESVFRRIEALRMNLAKHEVKGKPQLAFAPGYSRIDDMTGSLVWFVDLGDRHVDMVSRQELGDELREAVIGHLLPDDELHEDSKHEEDEKP